MFDFIFSPKCYSYFDCLITHYKDTITVITGIVGTLVVTITFLFAVIQYRNAQRWKRNEFLVQKIEEFYEDKDVVVFFSMLDYYGKSFKFDEDGQSKDLVVFHLQGESREPTASLYVEDLGTALHFHEEGLVNPAQEYIRNLFDKYCYYLQTFAIFIQNKLFTVAEIEPYLRYHVDILNGRKTHSQGYHEQMFKYLVLYEQEWTIKLLSMFPQSDIVKSSIVKAKEEKAGMQG